MAESMKEFKARVRAYESKKKLKVKDERTRLPKKDS